MIEFEIPIDESCSGLRIDRVLAQDPRIATRARAQKLIEQNRVKILGAAVKASRLVALGEIYWVALPEPTTTELEPLDLKLEILFEDENLIVVNKPAGLVVHPAAGHAQDTLVNALLHHTDKLSMGFNEQRPGIVHRLDRDTSGVLVIARNDFAHRSLSEQFQARTITRIYHAIVLGQPQQASGRIESHIKRDPRNRKRFTTAESGGKWAATHYKVLANSPKGVSLLQLQLETGRTHQIRVHLSELGHPVLGDELYGGMPKNRLGGQLLSLVRESKRFALHAHSLGFQHPRTGEHLHFQTAWPADLLPIVEFCGFTLRG